MQRSDGGGRHHRGIPGAGEQQGEGNRPHFSGRSPVIPGFPRVVLGPAWAFQPLVSGARTPPARSWAFRDDERARWSQSLSSLPSLETIRRRKARAAGQGDSPRDQHRRLGSRHRTAGERWAGKRGHVMRQFRDAALSGVRLKGPCTSVRFH